MRFKAPVLVSEQSVCGTASGGQKPMQAIGRRRNHGDILKSPSFLRDRSRLFFFFLNFIFLYQSGLWVQRR